eukprot:scaffold34463_cov69-Phaeocystis_antarctica.AAC.4
MARGAEVGSVAQRGCDEDGVSVERVVLALRLEQLAAEAPTRPPIGGARDLLGGIRIEAVAQQAEPMQRRRASARGGQRGGENRCRARVEGHLGECRE